ncbi:hypothetical protein D3C87_1533500 [compost metagenome]
MGIPSAHVHKAQVVAVGHEAGDAANFLFQLVGGYRVAAGRLHFGFQLLARGAHDALAFVHGRMQVRVAIHGGDGAVVGRAQARLPVCPAQINVRYARLAPEDLRHFGCECRRLGARRARRVQGGGQAIQEP